ncbi:hypothetical protein PAECIP111891_02168 [Paenibacillus allorhizoplanae]|uniref:Copper amine oxidase-like N-terminal domain-containing protein n=1 Tax=Paenibacillus allorhizoplanae TaxID=2905648 RepID=A0ABM9C3F3_9BACL|nr:stalk domain-containing protein [Paenibacillus allorhizoplanae]CAH1202958.1 hypothetical protein PAECIP111891_02168 [Paenibacillus allorhizoplanae]
MKTFLKSKKAMFLGALAIFTLGNVSGVSASTTLKEITAYLDGGIRLVVNGLPFTAKDSDGKVLAPINYEGNTYLPLRSVAEATGMNVKWDEATRTATLGPLNQTNGEDFVLKAIDNSFQVTFPSTWTRNDTLLKRINPLFEVGAVNNSKNPAQFFAVTSEDKSGFSDELHVNGYGKLILDQMKEIAIVKNVKIISEKDIEINGLPSKQFEVTGIVNDSLNAAYLITFVESKSYFYQLMFWSAAKNIEDLESLTKIASTFKELSK